MVVPALGSATLLVRAGAGEFREVGLPAPVGGAAGRLGAGAARPGRRRPGLPDRPADRRVARRAVRPPVRPGPADPLAAPVALGGDAVALADESGVVRRLVRVERPEAPAGRRGRDVARLGRSPPTRPRPPARSSWRRPTAGSASLSARDLSPVGAWPLDAAAGRRPRRPSAGLLRRRPAGGVLALGEDGQRLWSAKLAGTGDAVAVAGPPAVLGAAVWFLTRDGVAPRPRPSPTARRVDGPSLGVLPAGGPDRRRRRPGRPGRARGRSRLLTRAATGSSDR